MRRDLAGIDEGNPLSRGPSGPLRSSKSGKPGHLSGDGNLLAIATPKPKRTAAAANLRLTTIAAT